MVQRVWHWPNCLSLNSDIVLHFTNGYCICEQSGQSYQSILVRYTVLNRLNQHFGCSQTFVKDGWEGPTSDIINKSGRWTDHEPKSTNIQDLPVYNFVPSPILFPPYVIYVVNFVLWFLDFSDFSFFYFIFSFFCTDQNKIANKYLVLFFCIFALRTRNVKTIQQNVL